MKAFPQSMNNVGGMDLRDYFAAKAMQAIIINSKERDICVDEIDGWVGHYAYTVADAMMQERKVNHD